MNDRHPGQYDSEYQPEGNGAAVPRDLPDQHARPGEDPLDVEVEGLGSSGDPDPDPDSGHEADEAETPEEPDTELPDTDEAGAGRRGSPSTGGVHEQPVPDEPSG